jgi:hypothetical protein
MPPGRKIKTSTRMPKATTGWSWFGESMPAPVRNRMGPRASKIPRRRPPIAAPGMLQIPPRTAEVNALIPGKTPIVKMT